ncbi:MAG: histidine phosphatase family protein [Oscillospiraceae bacterium]|nr:histidine phosphatase family protein [Oscillospiraceae bacterium]
MRLLIVRHADPDYSIDSLTEKGWREAELLSDRLSKLDVKAFYCSPLGRAQDTASLTLKKMGRETETLEWLKEFYYCQVTPPYLNEGETVITWDFMPSFFTKCNDLYDKDKFMHVDFMEKGNYPALYKAVTDGLDELLEKHGYRRNGRYYDAVEPNRDTIVLFCHFGIECQLLGHLLSISPVVLGQNFCAAPSSVTTLYTEEREQGVASFRMAAFGDTSHLYAAGEEPAFAARFCETFDSDERH